MEVIASLAELAAKIADCNAALAGGSDDAMRKLFTTFRFEVSADLPQDPFGAEYRAVQSRLYELVSGRGYRLENERTPVDVDAAVRRPFPYYTGSTTTAGHHLAAIGFLLGALRLAPGARIVEFGPGWGNTTIELARLGFDVTAVDIEPRFCELIRRRAAAHAVPVNVVEGDFFWAEAVREPFDAAIFFECFHHCNDHMRLLRALRRAVAPSGQVYLGSEPIFSAYPVPWGIRMDGEALWAMRNFGWLELGFDASYFREALARTGWRGVEQPCEPMYWAGVWTLTPDDDAPRLPEGVFPPIRGAAARWDGLAVAERPALPEAADVDAAARALEAALRELDAVYRSTSWRITRPLRLLRTSLRPRAVHQSGGSGRGMR